MVMGHWISAHIAHFHFMCAERKTRFALAALAWSALTRMGNGRRFLARTSNFPWNNDAFGTEPMQMIAQTCVRTNHNAEKKLLFLLFGVRLHFPRLQKHSSELRPLWRVWDIFAGLFVVGRQRASHRPRAGTRREKREEEKESIHRAVTNCF